MSEDKSIKLIKAVKELNIGMGTIVDFLASKGYKVEKQPMAKLDGEMYNVLLKEFAADKVIKEEAKQISIGKIRKEEAPAAPEQRPAEQRRNRDFENEEILIKNAGQFTSTPAEKPKPRTCGVQLRVSTIHPSAATAIVRRALTEGERHETCQSFAYSRGPAGYRQPGAGPTRPS